MYELDNINGSYGKDGLAPQKLVPCNCPDCKRLVADKKDPNFYEYADLMRRKERGKRTVECKVSYNDVEVLRLIDDVLVTNYFAPKPLRVFVSYSKADEAYKVELEKHLNVLKRQNLISTWSDRQLVAGEEWDKRIKSELSQADIILLLVSSDFIATDYVWDIEIQRALERHERGEARVIPIILRPCLWSVAPFAKLNALPNKGKPISEYNNKDEAWAEIAEKLRVLVTELYKLKS